MAQRARGVRRIGRERLGLVAPGALHVPQLGGDGDAVARVGSVGRIADDAQPEKRGLAAEQDGAMRRAVQPGRDEVARRAGTAAAQREDLPGPPPFVGGWPAHAPQPVGLVATRGGHVAEVAPRDHVGGVTARGLAQLTVRAQHRPPTLLAHGVDQAGERGAALRDGRRGDRRLGAIAGSGGAGEPGVGRGRRDRHRHGERDSPGVRRRTPLMVHVHGPPCSVSEIVDLFPQTAPSATFGHSAPLRQRNLCIVATRRLTPDRPARRTTWCGSPARRPRRMRRGRRSRRSRSRDGLRGRR